MKLIPQPKKKVVIRDTTEAMEFRRILDQNGIDYDHMVELHSHVFKIGKQHED